MKCCPNCGKVVPNDKNFCESCGSSVDFPGIRDDGPKKVQNNGKNSKNDNKEEIEILDTNVKKQEKYCCICGKKLDKKGICKECESSTFMPGVNKNDIYKFCGHCGQELNKDGICEQCGSSVIFPGIRESNQKQDKNSKKNNTEEIEVLDNNGKKQEKHCIKCNKKLNKNNRYCINCGKKIDRDFNTCLECTKKEKSEELYCNECVKNIKNDNSNPAAAVFFSVLSLLFFLVDILPLGLRLYGINYLLSFIFIILARISDTKNVCAKVIMWIEIAFIIFGILFWYFIILSCEN